MKKATVRVMKFQTNFDHNRHVEFSGGLLSEATILRTYGNGWMISLFGETLFLQNHNRDVKITRQQALTCEWYFSHRA